MPTIPLRAAETLTPHATPHHGFAAGIVGNSFHIAGGGFQSDGMPGVNTKTAVHEVLDLGR